VRDQRSLRFVSAVRSPPFSATLATLRNTLATLEALGVMSLRNTIATPLIMSLRNTLATPRIMCSCLVAPVCRRQRVCV